VGTVYDDSDPDMMDGCVLDFSSEPTSDEDLALVTLTGDAKDLETMEMKINQYKELFSHG